MIWNIDPVLLEIGPLEIRYYGLFFALGLLAGYTLARNFAKRAKLSADHIDNIVIYVVIGLILGARLGHVFFYEWPYYSQNLGQIVQIWNGGLASHGGAIGAILAVLFYKSQNKNIDLWKYADILTIGSGFMVIFVRLGNFFNSEILGRPTDLPWGIQFIRIDDVVRHPSQLYEMLIGIFALAVLAPLWIKQHKTRKAGFFFGAFLFIYFGGRFIAEFAKDLAIQEQLFGLTTGQLLSLPFALVGLYFMWRKRK